MEENFLKGRTIIDSLIPAKFLQTLSLYFSLSRIKNLFIENWAVIKVSSNLNSDKMKMFNVSASQVNKILNFFLS